jgi:hypothetical protein
MAKPIPYKIIWNLIKQGEVIPFLGAGASLSGRPSDVEWTDEAQFLPTGGELASLLADDAQFPPSELLELCNQYREDLNNIQAQLEEAQSKLESMRAERKAIKSIQDPINEAQTKLADLERGIQSLDDLAKVASFYQEQGDRPALRLRLRELFLKDYQPGKVHEFLADVETPLLIVTTNYDDLIEQAFDNKNKPYHLVVHPTDLPADEASVLWWKPREKDPEIRPPNALRIRFDDNTTIIYKMHGSIDRHTNRWDSYVITEEDYVEFLSRMTSNSAVPARLMAEFSKKRFLFLGYGLGDWNLRVILKNLQSAVASQRKGKDYHRGDELKSWAIQYRPTDLEEYLWNARNVNIHDEDVDVFISKMREVMY